MGEWRVKRAKRTREYEERQVKCALSSQILLLLLCSFLSSFIQLNVCSFSFTYFNWMKWMRDRSVNWLCALVSFIYFIPLCFILIERSEITWFISFLSCDSICFILSPLLLFKIKFTLPFHSISFKQKQREERHETNYEVKCDSFSFQYPLSFKLNLQNIKSSSQHSPTGVRFFHHNISKVGAVFAIQLKHERRNERGILFHQSFIVGY